MGGDAQGQDQEVEIMTRLDTTATLPAKRTMAAARPVFHGKYHMTHVSILVVPVRGHKPSSVQPRECRPRLYEADRERLDREPDVIALDELPARVYDPLAARPADHGPPKLASQYWRRRRHLFGWPPAQNRSRPAAVVTTSKSA